MAQSKPNSLPTPTYIIPSTKHELKMSYGMFNDIMRIVGGANDITIALISDPLSRDLVLRRLFTDNSKAIGEDDELVDSFDIDILPSELDGILAWVAEHVTHFLVSTGRAMKGTLQKYQNQLNDLVLPENPSSK